MNLNIVRILFIYIYIYIHMFFSSFVYRNLRYAKLLSDKSKYSSSQNPFNLKIDNCKKTQLVLLFSKHSSPTLAIILLTIWKLYTAQQHVFKYYQTSISLQHYKNIENSECWNYSYTFKNFFSTFSVNIYRFFPNLKILCFANLRNQLK